MKQDIIMNIEQTTTYDRSEKEKSGTCYLYRVADVSQIHDQKRFTISEVAAD